MTTIQRELLLDCGLEEAEELTTTVDGLRCWFADEVDVALVPGSIGTMTDDGEEYEISVDAVGNRSLSFTLAPTTRPDAISIVHIIATPGEDGGTSVNISETWPAPITASAASDATVSAGAADAIRLRWDLRAMLLWRCGQRVAINA